MLKIFRKPEKPRVCIAAIFDEIDKLGINSVGIVFIISIFMGAVITLQTAYNIEISFVPLYLVGLTARDSMILEFSSTIVGLILAGKVGANIASEIGMMRVNEQIEALEAEKAELEEAEEELDANAFERGDLIKSEDRIIMVCDDDGANAFVCLRDGDGENCGIVLDELSGDYELLNGRRF